MSGFTIKSNAPYWKEIGMTCPRYQPCPICYRCDNKASHLFVKCQVCEIPYCTHTQREREFMIRRENFAAKLARRDD